jgi:two-component system invasion response regulator UvrY
MEKITVLIVDDHALIREAWALLLENHEEAFEVIANVGDGQRAIELARDKRPDIIMLDINMVPLSGFDIITTILKLSPRSKVIAISMHVQSAYAKKMFQLGARGYVTKNSSSQEMLTAIKTVHAGQNYICQEVKNILSVEMLEGDNSKPGLNQLTMRELEIVNLIRDGQSSKEISAGLNIACKTVEVHRHNILKKLNVKNAAALINLINSNGLI